MFGYRAMPKRKKTADESATAGDRLNIRIDLAGGLRIGPGKVAVLEEIARSGSISAAGRALAAGIIDQRLMEHAWQNETSQPLPAQLAKGLFDLREDSM